jgi:hypothetical protein
MFIDNLRSRIALVKYDFAEVVHQLQDGDPDSLATFQKLLGKLFSDPALSSLTIDRINAAVDGLELAQRSDVAGQANQILLVESGNLDPGGIARQLVARTRQRAKRLALAGKTLPADLTVAAGGQLDLSAQAGRKLVLVFWSPSEPASVDFVKQIAAARPGDANRAWELVGVCLSKNKSIPQTLFGGSLPEWPIVVADDESRDLADEFGVLRLPHIMLLDETHRITSTACTPDTTERKIAEWSAQAVNLPNR